MPATAHHSFQTTLLMYSQLCLNCGLTRSSDGCSTCNPSPRRLSSPRLQPKCPAVVTLPSTLQSTTAHLGLFTVAILAAIALYALYIAPATTPITS